MVTYLFLGQQRTEISQERIQATSTEYYQQLVQCFNVPLVLYKKLQL